MHSFTPERSPSWRDRARELLSRLLHPLTRQPRDFVAWADMQPIDFEGEDTSLTERDLRHMK